MASSSQNVAQPVETKMFVPKLGEMSEFVEYLNDTQLELFYGAVRDSMLQCAGNLQDYMFNASKRESFEAAHANGQVSLTNAIYDVVAKEVRARKAGVKRQPQQ
jgi:hypothetical protein